MEPNAPVDVGRSEIAPYKESVEELLTEFRYRGATHALPDLIRNVDPTEKHIMGELERETYIALREGLQVLRALTAMVSDKIGLKERLARTPTSALRTDRTIAVMRGFCLEFATYAASACISRRLDTLLRSHGDVEGQDRPDLSMLDLDFGQPETSVIRRLLAPVYANLIDHVERGEVFRTPRELPVYVKEVFDRYAELALAARSPNAELDPHIEDYQFRILDGLVVLQGFEDHSTPTVAAVEQQVTFQPIRPEEIVGNRAAKRKIVRYVDRLALYDTTEQRNPVLALGGLSWSNLFDGPPGTGKSSLFRLAMTRLKERCDQAGQRYHIVTVDQSIKDEFYGKTGKILLQRLFVTQDAGALSLVVFDDIDLLTSTRGDAQGADNDINNIVMQYLDGVFTVRRGNVINFAASNRPTGVDDALRNRFNDRLLIDGPTTPEDFADMVVLMGSDMMDRGLLELELGYEPFQTQDVLDANGGWSGENVAAYMAEEFERYRGATVRDFGGFVAELKQRNPGITGRSMRAIVEAVKERCAEFDVPAAWFDRRDLFFDRSYDGKVEQLAALYAPVTADILFQEAQRYFESEERFTRAEAEGHVERGYNNLMWKVQAELKYQEEQHERGQASDLARLHALRRVTEQLSAERARVIESALQHAGQDRGP